MKIGIVCPYNLFRPGGVQEHVLAEYAELVRRGHDVRIITPLPKGHEEDAPKDWIFLGQSTIFYAPQNTTPEVSATVDIAAIDAVLEAEKFEVLQVHEPLVPLLPRQILGRCEAIKIGTFHAAKPGNIMGKSIAKSVGLFIRSVVKQLDAITAVSPAATDYVKDYIDLPVTYIANGIDLTTYKKDATIPRDKSTIFYVGRLEKRKGVDYLLEAFAILQKTMPHVQLIIAGDGPEREKLEEQSRLLGLQHVKFVGFVSHDEKKRYMQQCSVFCSPAIYGESFGIVLLEAMALGAPVIAGDNPGYEHVLRGRGMVGLVNPKDSVDFARRLAYFLTDDEFTTLWRKWSDTYVKTYSYKHIVDEYEKLFTSLLKK
jgi:phosphatidyl-myo-inositol alpha-mannosyltransferase